MGGGLDAALARVREYRRWIGYRRQAAQASAILDERDRVNAGGGASPAPAGGDGTQPTPSSSVRRSLMSAGAAMVLALVAVAAISLGVSELNQKPHPSQQPYAAVNPTGAGPGSFVSTPPTPGVADGRTLPSATAALTGAVSGAAPAAATGSATDAAPTPAGTSTAASAGTPSAGASPTLLDLCRSVVAAGTSWPSVLKGADRATVIAAAGKKNNVLAYCTALVAGAPTP